MSLKIDVGYLIISPGGKYYRNGEDQILKRVHSVGSEKSYRKNTITIYICEGVICLIIVN